jgi:glycosyltransferase involved in cell wall biosynthesis
MASDSSRSALVLAPEAPYPLAGGGALRTASLLHYLAQTHSVDLLVFREPGAPDPAGFLPPGLVRRILVLDLPAHRRGVAARTLRNAARLARHAPPLVDRFSGFAGAVARQLEGCRYDIGVVEHFWCAPYWDQLAPLCRQTVLNLHNIESELHRSCADADGGVAGFAHRIFRRASLDLERDWLPRYSQILAASENDAARARAIAPSACVSVYPNAIPATALPPRSDPGEPDAVAFSGNLEYHPNLSAVRFFRDQVWPHLRSRWPNLVWRLIGKNPEAVKNLTSGDPRIQMTGPVEDAVRELARARVAVVPLLSGSGTRLKIIEAWAAGLPVVSTRVGAEGLPARDGDSIVLADTGPDFAAAVTRLLASPALRQALGSRGRMLVEQQFTWETAWKMLNF